MLLNVYMLRRGRRAGLDKKFVKALEPSLAHRLQDWQLMGCEDVRLRPFGHELHVCLVLDVLDVKRKLPTRDI